ncbi:hypothetical protein DdX_10089 [Ditylenchus destructor]|uniref:Uncharacterized protein n=1 Tax=Ditylenchus destructor TaxID=166010 RepID=A0AAD4QZI9_9BILA|nr:hypothetical protein DdX_10089 [Ditylenchus destructor]
MASNALLHIVFTFQIIAILIFSVVATALFSRILYLYCCRRGSGLCVRCLSKCMISYMILNSIGLITAIPYYASKLPIFHQPSSPELEFWLSTIGMTDLGVMPLTVFFLALERCLAIQFRFSKKLEKIVFASNLISVLAITFTNFIVCSLGYRSSFLFVFKMVIGVLNIGACAFLCWKVHHFKRNSKYNISNTKNTIVKFTCISELILEFLPNLVATVIIMTVGRELFAYTGPFATTTQCLNVMICAIIYSKTLHSKNKSSTVVFTHSSK